jgi:hypothetical protein
MLPTKFRFIWPSRFREDFLDIDQSETRIACGGHICQQIKTKLAASMEGPIKIAHFVSICSQTWSPLAILVSDWSISKNSSLKPLSRKHLWKILYKECSFRRFFRNRPIRNKNCLWRSCLLTDRDEMSNLYRGPSIDASYQVSVHLAKQIQRRFFRYRPISRWQFLFLIGRFLKTLL